MDNHAREWQILSGGVCRDESICQERAVSWNLSISSISDGLELTTVDRQNVDRRLAYSLSRYSDRLISISVAIDQTQSAIHPVGSAHLLCTKTITSRHITTSAHAPPPQRVDLHDEVVGKRVGGRGCSRVV